VCVCVCVCVGCVQIQVVGHIFRGVTTVGLVVSSSYQCLVRVGRVHSHVCACVCLLRTSEIEREITL
jgi:uncharacterized protein (DUF2235 family)